MALSLLPPKRFEKENAMEAKEHGSQGPSCESFANSIGFALAELLLLTGREEELGACIHSVQATAYAAIFSARPVRPVQFLHDAALAVVWAWHEETDDLNALADSIASLQEVLEVLGIRYVPCSLESE